MCLKCAHHSVWGQLVFTFIYYNSFPTSPLSVAKESTTVEKCVRQPWSWCEAPHISTVISLLIHLIVDVKKCVRHFFVRTHPLYMRPQCFCYWECICLCTWKYFNSFGKTSIITRNVFLHLYLVQWIPYKHVEKGTPASGTEMVHGSILQHIWTNYLAVWVFLQVTHISSTVHSKFISMWVSSLERFSSGNWAAFFPSSSAFLLPFVTGSVFLVCAAHL